MTFVFQQEIQVMIVIISGLNALFQSLIRKSIFIEYHILGDENISTHNVKKNIAFNSSFKTQKHTFSSPRVQLGSIIIKSTSKT